MMSRGHLAPGPRQLRPAGLRQAVLAAPRHAAAPVTQRQRPSARAAAAMPMKEVIESLMARRDLSEEQAQAAMTGLLADFVPEQAAAMLVLLHAKGETPAEVAGFARALLASSEAVPVEQPSSLVDIVGTGGDGIGSVNISTGACVVAAAAGARVAKHGGRSVSSLCGSADVLEALGVAIELGPAGVAACLERSRLGFMYAPRYHAAMAALRPVRGALRVRTVANILGPLLNPAHAGTALVGVYSPAISELMAGSLARLGLSRALVVHSCGLDELTPMGPADVVEMVAGKPLARYSLDPADLGIPRCEVADLAGGDAATNAAILRDVFGGARGAVADALVLNAGYALAAAGVAGGPAEGVAMAQEAQRSGRAGDTLAAWVAASQEEAAKEAAAKGAAAAGGGQALSTAATA